MGGSHYSVTCTRQSDFTLCDGSEYKRIRGLGRVCFFLFRIDSHGRRTKKRDIYVISTSKRPVPLEHYLFADREIYKIVDSNKKFLGQGWKEANDALSKDIPEKKDLKKPTLNRGGARGGRGVNRGSFTKSQSGRASIKTDQNVYVHLIGLLRKKSLLPAIIFSFSKRKCEEFAATLQNIDLTTGSAEKSEIHVFCERSLNRLKGSDKELPQVLRMRELLGRGIGVHHGGLLPILKEVLLSLFRRVYA